MKVITQNIFAYKGALSVLTSPLCPSPARGGKGIRFINAQLQWPDYGASTNNPAVAALVNLNFSSVDPFNSVQSCYIDNSGCPQPCYVRFPDTGFTICCPPYETVLSPVITNSLTALIATQDYATESIPSTVSVYFCDGLLPGLDTAEQNRIVSQGLQSRGIGHFSQRNGQRYYPFALGDSITSAQLDLSVNGQTVNLFNSPQQSGFYIVNAVWVDYFGITIGVNSPVGIKIESPNPLIGSVWDLPTFCRNGQFYDHVPMAQMSGLQIRLNAQQVYQARVNFPATQGTANVWIAYTFVFEDVN